MKNPFNKSNQQVKLALESFVMHQIAYYINSMLEDWDNDISASRHRLLKDDNYANWYIYLDSLIDKYNITYEQLQENRVYLDNIKSTGETEND